MPDIPQPVTVAAVEQRPDGRSRGGGASSDRPPARKVAETYQEVDRSKPVDDRVTVLGIPIEQITPSTQAALAGLVAEINTLRALVRRLEGTNRITTAALTPVLEPSAFFGQLGAMLAASPGEGFVWVMVLVHVQTFEDLRRSSGVLAANAALADVAHRLRQAGLPIQPASAEAEPVSQPFGLVGYVGGPTLGALAALPAQDLDPTAIARQVRDALTTDGYDVAGLSMALAITTAAAVAGVGESPLLAVARVDHLTRGR